MVGKTSLITRYITGKFDEKREKRTIEAYFKEKTIKINENSFNLNIWVKNYFNLLVGYRRGRKISRISAYIL
jgi:hypothetical protein